MASVSALFALRLNWSAIKLSVSASLPCSPFSLPWVTLLLAGIGLSGVLNYSVLQRRREMGVPPSHRLASCRNRSP